MSDSITVRKMYKYRLYRNDKRDRNLRHKLFVASTVWNHFIALQRRYYCLTGKYISLARVNRHVLKLRKTKQFALWHDLHSQVCQEVCRRVDNAYQRFFKGLAMQPPKFKKAKKYKSFTFPQSGYKLVEWNQNQAKSNGQWSRARRGARGEGKLLQAPCSGCKRNFTFSISVVSLNVFEPTRVDALVLACCGGKHGSPSAFPAQCAYAASRKPYQPHTDAVRPSVFRR